MNVLVTGSGGFLGRTLYDSSLEDRKHQYIWGTTNPSCPYGTLFEPEYRNCTQVVSKMGHGIDCLIHLAAAIPQSFGKATYDLFLQNAAMMENLRQLVEALGIQRVIYLSGFGSMQNYEEYKLKDYYTLSKVHGEHVCSIMEACGGQTASLRVSAPYGPYSRESTVVNIFIQNALRGDPLTLWGTGKREQNFVYSKDVASAIRLCLESAKPISGVYEIVSQENVSMHRLAETIKEATGSASKIMMNGVDPQEDFRPHYSFMRAQQEFGYHPQYDIANGIHDYLAWMETQKS